MTMIRKDSYTFAPDDFPKGYTVKQQFDHYEEQRYIFIIEALFTPYERVTERLKTRWHGQGLRMPSPYTGIGRSMQDDFKAYRARYEEANKARQLNETVRLWWGNTTTFIKTLMRV